ncbi:PR-1-like protein [Teratosphaeria nubilosa]|uniref:PR-1-like protein n=1 Tax=Teratosphaeria nubilosa TaxID=161662 RepID=A0A6G1KU53_9PEZI|nr:PR-1-like protein [Teratosphaeria nubilosa]
MSTTSKATATATSTSSLQSAVLNSTNYYRTLYQANAVEWNTTLVQHATNWAAECLWEHSGGPYGENLALGYSSAGAGIDAWAAEASLYNFSDPGVSSSTGHFTQLVWQDTTQVGRALVACNNAASGGAKRNCLVCEYSKTRGNILGEFATEVKPPVSKRGLLEEEVNEGIVEGEELVARQAGSAAELGLGAARLLGTLVAVYVLASALM